VRCDPERDLLVAEVEGNPVAYSRVWWDDEADGRIYKFVCFVDPAFGGRRIGTTLLAWNEARLGEIARDHDVGAKLVQAFIGDANAAATALVRGAGYEPGTYMAEMVRPSVDDLPDHQLPEGLEIRPVREEDIRTIWEADVEAFKDHWGYVEPTEAEYERFRAYPYLDPMLWKIAWDDEGVAGQVKSFIDTAQNEEHGRKRGWTEQISTARRWRREGRREGAHRRVDPRARRPRYDPRSLSACTRRIRPAPTSCTRTSVTRSRGHGRPTASRSDPGVLRERWGRAKLSFEDREVH
jgi:mycothiol synthase